MRLTTSFALCVLVITSGTGVQAGDPTSIDASSPELVAWASELVEFAATPSGAGTGSEALGIPDATFASLGDLDDPEINAGNAPGSITLSFGGQSIVNGSGWDFAVFENAGEFFDAPFIFAELGFVQVSTDGQSFAQFPATSLNTEPGTGTSDTDLIVPFGRDFAGVNANNVNNLAGIHPQGFGTVFDLMDLELDPLVTSGVVDLDEINFVRVVDIPGNGAFLDEAGRPILDAWLTTGTGGFDIDAVGVRNIVPEPIGQALLLAGIGLWCGLRRNRRR
ncbi:MAG: PEP-CTERM sorting domain-containing protein [Planctomycetota bacterium]